MLFNTGVQGRRWAISEGPSPSVPLPRDRQGCAWEDTGRLLWTFSTLLPYRKDRGSRVPGCWALPASGLGAASWGVGVWRRHRVPKGAGLLGALGEWSWPVGGGGFCLVLGCNSVAEDQSPGWESPKAREAPPIQHSRPCGPILLWLRCFPRGLSLHLSLCP